MNGSLECFAANIRLLGCDRYGLKLLEMGSCASEPCGPQIQEDFVTKGGKEPFAALANKIGQAEES
jgi:hypothetical protein